MRLVIVVSLNYLVSKWMFQYLHNGYVSNSQQPLLMCRVLIDSRSAVMPAAVPNSYIPLLLVLGFITMTPQLFINYKMKSVAHLPWRMLTYKALNTFIDDLFAFVIKMPMMYRIGCLRDGMSSLIWMFMFCIFWKLTVHFNWMCSQIIFTMNSFWDVNAALV